jgi:hypothetical protein
MDKKQQKELFSHNHGIVLLDAAARSGVPVSIQSEETTNGYADWHCYIGEERYGNGGDANAAAVDAIIRFIQKNIPKKK